MKSWTQSGWQTSKPIFFPSQKNADIVQSPKAASYPLGACDWGQELLSVPHGGNASIPMLQRFLGHSQLPTFTSFPVQRPCCQPAFPNHLTLLHQRLQFPGMCIHLGCIWAGRRCICLGTFVSPLAPYSSAERPEPGGQLLLFQSSLSFSTFPSFQPLPSV